MTKVKESIRTHRAGRTRKAVQRPTGRLPARQLPGSKQTLRCDLSTIDLAILDFDMPGMNGRDLFLHLRALHARFPILLLSASASTLSPEDRVLFSQCLDKGGPVRHLLDIIGAFLDPNEIPDFGR